MMAFMNGGVLLISFALLLIVLSFSVSQINSTGVFANAQSVAGAIGSKLITSPNCFAYTNTVNYYNSSIQNMSNGPFYSAQDTEPGTIDVNKFVMNGFLSCMQYIYFGGATDIPSLQSKLAAATGVTLYLVDTQDPKELGPQGFLYLSNMNQFNYGQLFNSFNSKVASFAQTAQYAATAASIAISIPIMILTGGILSPNIILAVGTNAQSSILPQYAVGGIFNSENTYTEMFPIIIQFTNGENQPTFQNSGILYVVIHYGMAPYD